MKNLLGRKYEASLLQQSLEMGRSELIAVYGRKRVGKTFLIREFFKKEIVFEVSGLYNGTMKDQIENFVSEIYRRSRRRKPEPTAGWMEAFSILENYLTKLKQPAKKVVFIDEFPWIATARSKFLMTFENFWNRFCTKRNDLIVVVCGSAASYMIRKVIKNKGGLHNRITQQIRLIPFNLYETAQFLKSRGLNYTLYDILQIYMVIGGIPHYLDKLQKGKSVAQNIDHLCFEKDSV